MWDTQELRDTCTLREHALKKMYAPYVEAFVDTLVSKARTHWHAYYHMLLEACKNAKTKKDRYIFFHHFVPTERIYVGRAFVLLDELMRYTNVLKRLEMAFGHHFKVRVHPLSNSNFSHTIALHYYP